MSTLDDKILGEKLHYYCSSSEEEDNLEENLSQNNTTDDTINSNVIREESQHIQQWDGRSVNTGPKGVIKDYQRYKQFQNEKRDDNQRQKLELIKKLSISCRSQLEEELAKNESSEEDDLNDDFLKEYMLKRMHQMLEQTKDRPDFGELIYLESGSEFLEAIDNENKLVSIICHIYTQDVNHCQHINSCLSSLAQQYIKVKFCAIEASTAGMSKHFSRNGVPALMVYKAGNLLANFVRLTDQLNESFLAEDIEKFLIEHGILAESSALNSNVRNSIRESVDNEDLSD